MKKLLCLLLSLLLLFSAAAADQDNWVESDPVLYVGAIEDLLFSTHNVTLTGEAHFSLDGDWFKTANGVYRQDGENSYWDYRLTAPGSSGSIRENGYTIVANPDQYYVMESYPHPGTYRNGADYAEDTVLRKTGQTQTMILVLRQLANNAYTILDKDAVTVSADESRNETLHIQLGENTPDMVNLALTLFWQYAARRFLETDTELVNDSLLGESQWDYSTVSKYLLATTRYLTVKKADITVKMNNLGQLDQIIGSASVQLCTALNEDRLLDAVFRLDVSDRGSTKVDEFRPEDYDVVLYDEAADTPAIDEARMDRDEGWSDHAYFSWERAGYESEMEQFHSGSGRWIGDCFFIRYENDDNTESVLTVFDQAGELIEMKHDDGFDAEQVYTPYPDEQLISEALEKTRTFLEQRYPSVAERMGDMKLSWWSEKDGRVEFFFEQDPAPDTHSITMLIRALPEWHVELINCESN